MLLSRFPLEILCMPLVVAWLYFILSWNISRLNCSRDSSVLLIVMQELFSSNFWGSAIVWGAHLVSCSPLLWQAPSKHSPLFFSRIHLLHIYTKSLCICNWNILIQQFSLPDYCWLFLTQMSNLCKSLWKAMKNFWPGHYWYLHTQVKHNYFQMYQLEITWFSFLI